MLSNSEHKPEKPARTLYPLLFFILVGAISILVLAASIVPLNNLIVRYTLCPTASAAYFQPPSGGISPFGMDRDSGGKNVTLYCNHENGAVRRFDSSAIAGAGFGGSMGIGVFIGLMVYHAMYNQVRRSSPAS